MAEGGELLEKTIANKVFEQQNRGNQPNPVRELQPIAKEITNELGVNKERTNVCEKVTNKAVTILDNIFRAVRAFPGAFARGIERATGNRNQYGQLNTASLLNNHHKKEGNYHKLFSKNKGQNNNNNNFKSITSSMNSTINSNNNPKGGSRTVHIKGVGKELSDKQKLVEDMFLLTKKKRYLN